MPNSTIELFDNTLLSGNLLNKTRPTADNSGTHIPDINSIQSKTNTEDVENTDGIQFQEILGQHIATSMPQSSSDSKESNHSAVELNISEQSTETIKETNLTAFNEQTHNTIHSANISPITFVSNPDSAIQGFGNKPSFNGKIGGNVDFDIYNPFTPNTNNENSTSSPFVLLPQRGNIGSSGKLRGIDVLQDKQFDKIYNQNSLFPTEKPLMQNLSIGNTFPQTDNIKLNPLNSPETLQALDDPLELNLQPSALDESDIDMKELPMLFKLLAQNVSPENKNGTPPTVINNPANATESNGKDGISKINGNLSSDISSTPQLNEEGNSFDNHTQKQYSSDTMSFDTPVQKTNNGSPFSLDTQTITDSIQSNTSSFQNNNTQASPHNGTTLSPSIEGNKDSVNHMFQSTLNSGVEHTHGNIMEQIFQRISLITHGDRSEIKLNLNPPELGNVKIHFTEENDEIKAKIFVENAEVKAAIENNVHRLKESVATNGIEIHKLEVYIQNNDANKQDSIENFTTNNPHHQNHTFSQNGFDEDHAGNEENVNEPQIETLRNTPNLTVDYII